MTNNEVSKILANFTNRNCGKVQFPDKPKLVDFTCFFQETRDTTQIPSCKPINIFPIVLKAASTLLSTNSELYKIHSNC